MEAPWRAFLTDGQVASGEATVTTLEVHRAASLAADRPMAFVASVCGTAADPQGFDAQARTLRDAGVLLAGSNAAAARLAIRLVGGTDGEGDGP